MEWHGRDWRGMARPNLMPDQLDLLEYGARARDQGMSQALAAAERKEPRWGDRAFQWIEQYAREHRQFISEQCTDAAAAAGLVSPADPRAWGSPFQRAAKAGIIKRIGYGVSKRRHLSPTPLWESCVCR